MNGSEIFRGPEEDNDQGEYWSARQCIPALLTRTVGEDVQTICSVVQNTRGKKIAHSRLDEPVALYGLALKHGEEDCADAPCDSEGHDISSTIYSLYQGRFLTTVRTWVRVALIPSLFTKVRDELGYLSEYAEQNVHQLTSHRYLRRLVRIGRNLRSVIIQMVTRLERWERRDTCHDIVGRRKTTAMSMNQSSRAGVLALDGTCT